MRTLRGVAGTAIAVSVLALLVFPAGATTLIRQGLDRLTTDDEVILLGRVLDIHSYWNADHTFILTDVHVGPTRVLKGDPAQGEMTFTVMGGSVGDLTTLVIDGPDLVPGSEYVLFLHHEDLPGAARRLTVGNLAQGVFDVSDSPQGRRAVSQAARHPLMADGAGVAEPPGGAEGLMLDQLIDQVHRLAGDH
jgi:hypothetical protein